MQKKKKKILILGFILLGSVIVLGLGLKYIPFNKIISIRSSSETVTVCPEQTLGQAPNSFLVDFELTPGMKIPDRLYKGIAHSGIYSCKVFGNDSYSIPFIRNAGDIGMENLQTVGWSTWVYIFPTEKEINSSFFFAVYNEPGVNVIWKGISLSGPGIPRGKWFKISSVADLSGVSFKPDHQLKIYFWNRSKTNILVDDFHIVFGRDSERFGDSTRVDLTTKTPFAPKFNFPPFRTAFLEKEDIHNQNTAFLINDHGVKEGKINPDQIIIGGNFLNNALGLDAILVMKKNGTPEIFSFCPEEGRFMKVQIELPREAIPYFSARFVDKGTFLQNGYEQIFIESEKGFMLGQFEPVKEVCSQGNNLKTIFKVLWKSGSWETNHGQNTGKQIFYSGDFNGDQQTEILLVPGNGTWKLLRFIAKPDGNWKTIAEGNSDETANWNNNEAEFKISVGRFIAGLNHDVLLTVMKNKKPGEQKFSLIRFNSVHLKFDPIFPARQTHYGKTIGLDTLQIADILFVGNFNGNREKEIFRYNRDWRFDLKQIRFNDTTFQILQNIDFAGFSKDHNPKYYEVLSLIPGKFINSAVTSLLVIGRNCKNEKSDGKECLEYQNKSVLPDVISIYSMKHPVNK